LLDAVNRVAWFNPGPVHGDLEYGFIIVCGRFIVRRSKERIGTLIHDLFMAVASDIIDQ